MKNKEVENTYLNRELSWLEFNDRVLQEAEDVNNPLFERLKFLAIVSSNLDEFFMVRVASLWDQIQANYNEPDFALLTPKEQLKKISQRTHIMITDNYSCYNGALMPALKKEGIYFPKWKKLSQDQYDFLSDYYNDTIYPVLTPMVVDRSRPFPLILNKSLNIAMLLKNKDEDDEPLFATVQVPSVLTRFIEMPSFGDEDYTPANEEVLFGRCFILLEEVIKRNISSLFNGHEILSIGCYRITRNADLNIDEEESEDLLIEIQQSLKKRKWGSVIRLEVEKGMDKNLLVLLQEKFEVVVSDTYEIDGPIDLTFLMKLSSHEGYDNLKYKAIKPVTPTIFRENDDIFQIISKDDVFLHHPYESFDPVIQLVQQAAVDPHVLAIKQTLYRVSGKSPIVAALIQAAENGKQVTVLVELKARFDEENNIAWAKRLEKSGCHVIYGLVGLKTHSKILLIVRREETGIKRYVHLGTGNYNDVTARIYTDVSLFTCNSAIGADASSIFNMISGYSSFTKLYQLYVAPINLRERFMKLIQQEKAKAEEGKKALIIAKVNSLVDENIIAALYEASNAGVEIQLIVRGICCLKPNVPNLSENITVRSIVGRYLEHSRIYYFHNDGDSLIYASSADWMSRNLDRRVELLFPIEAPEPRRRVLDILHANLTDTEKSRVLRSDGTYAKIDRNGKDRLNCQDYFYKEAQESITYREAAFTSDDEFKPIFKSE